MLTRPLIGRDRTLAAFGALALLAAILVPSAAAPASANGCPSASTGGTYGGGNGSEATPFLIASTAHLLELAAADRANLIHHFKQTEDIDLAGCIWTPIDRFAGSYDGGGYTISGLTFNDGSEDDAGMFSEVRGSVTRVVLVDVDVNGDDFVGGLVGYLNGGSVTSSSVSGTVSGDDYVGGLVGYSSDGEISRSSSSADVEGEWLVGGLVGDNNSGSIFASFATGDVTASGFKVGGLVGLNGGTAKIEDSYALGNVTFQAYSSEVGGLVGLQGDTASIVRSYFAGMILLAGAVREDRGIETENNRVVVVGGGGLVGATALGSSTTVASSYWDRETSGTTLSMGGLDMSTAEMTDIRTFTDFATSNNKWSMVNGWAAFAPPPADPARVWGICEDVNDGYPFLLWEYESAPCGDDNGDDNDNDNGDGDGDGNGNAESGGGGSSASSTPVLTGGSAPSLPAGQGVWQQSDGTFRPLDLNPSGVSQLQYTAPGLTVTLSGGPGTSATNGLVTSPNGTIDCEVCTTLATGGVIEAWMFSTPRLVAAWRVEDLPCQRFAIPVGAPLDGAGPLPAGAHTLQLALPTASGMQAINVGVTVGGPVPASVPAGEGSVPMPLALLLAVLVSVGGAVLVGRRVLAVG
jgi:hypothetical protein